MSKRLVTFTLVLFASAASFGIEMTGLEVGDRRVTAELFLGARELDLTIELERVVGLDAASLGLAAERVAPAALRDRLPEGVRALPFVLSVNPPATGALSLAGTYDLEIRTQRLSFGGGRVLRLFRAVPGGPFEDVTKAMGGDGFWIRGEGYGAAEWLLAIDPRPASEVAEHKLALLESLLAAKGEHIHEALYAELWTVLGATRAAWERGTSREAIAELETFDDEVAARRGTGLPDVWRSTGDLENVAGELSSAARSLRFSLILAGVDAPTNPRVAQ